MNNITQDMKYKQSLMCYALKFGVARAARKYNRCRSYIYRWLKRYDGAIESLACHSRRPHSHPNQHTPEELSLIRNMRKRNPKLGIVDLWCRLRSRGYNRRIESLYRVLRKMGELPEPPKPAPYKPKPYQQMTRPGERVQIDVKHVPAACCVGAMKGRKLYQYTALDEFTRLRYLGAYEEASTYSSADFLCNAVAYFKRKGITVECVQTDNGFEFTNRLNPQGCSSQTLFEETAAELGITHKRIRPYTPRHNGKVERSHREDQKHFYNTHCFYSFDDFGAQLAVHHYRSNNRPMRPLQYSSPREFLRAYTVLNV
ncbi:MAG: DDE-type integrase/transposase/recombinase [Bacillota bacterium]